MFLNEYISFSSVFYILFLLKCVHTCSICWNLLATLGLEQLRNSLTSFFLRKQFRRAGKKALSYDIKLDITHDVVSRQGFYLLLNMMLAFLVSICLVPSSFFHVFQCVSSFSCFVSWFVFGLILNNVH